MASKHWSELAAAKRAQLSNSIPQEWLLRNLPPNETLTVIDFPEKSGLLTEREIEITRSEVSALLDKLTKGVWSAVEVTTAFAKRAVIAHQLVNCLTEVFIDRALKRAAELDQHLKTTGTVVGPLHGLPVSLKDQLSIKGIESTIGYTSYIGKYATKNAALVDILEAAGAVLYVKTNVPQTLMWGETYNHIFRRTLNPYNRALTPGGSSGGEGALIALRGSPLGVGSDIAGSVRVPAGFNNLYGLRPSQGRVPYAGCVNTLEGQDSVLSVLGPLSSSLSGVKVFLQAVLDQKPWLKDPLVVRKPWNEEEYRLAEHGEGKTMCFGVMWHDEIVLPHPPVVRALEETKRALEAAGHKVIDWKPLKHGELNTALWTIFTTGGAQDFQAALNEFQEPLISEMYPIDGGDVDTITTGIPGHRAMPPGVSAYEAWQVQKRRRDLRQEYLEHWNASVSLTGTGRPVDAIIAPVAHCAPPPHGGNRPPVYSMIWNALDYTALAMPTGLFADPALDPKKSPHEFFNDADKANYELYDPQVFKGAPIAIQLIGRTLEEEAVLGMAEVVGDALKKHFDLGRS